MHITEIPVGKFCFSVNVYVISDHSFGKEVTISSCLDEFPLRFSFSLEVRLGNASESIGNNHPIAGLSAKEEMGTSLSGTSCCSV